jgi:TRAP-type C4-dicarboxylate transport system permease small subunit
MSIIWSRWKRYSSHVLVAFLFIILFISSLDYWNWNDPSIVIFGFPQWILYIIIITCFLSIGYYFIIKFLWKEESF